MEYLLLALFMLEKVIVVRFAHKAGGLFASLTFFFTRRTWRGKEHGGKKLPQPRRFLKQLCV